jgi:hypothetical protein
MIKRAPGGPGTAPTWTSSAKDMVGCALGPSRLWFTLGFGIVNEVYYPRVDIPQIRDLGFIIADGEGFWAEVKRVADYRMSCWRLAFPPSKSCTSTSAIRCACASPRTRGVMCWRSNAVSTAIPS